MRRVTVALAVAFALVIPVASPVLAQSETVTSQTTHKNASIAAAATREDEEAFLNRVREAKQEALRQYAQSFMKSVHSAQTKPGPGGVNALGTGQYNYLTWNIGHGSQTINGAYYYNNGILADAGISNANSWWDSSVNQCNANARSSILYGHADAWCDAGNQFYLDISGTSPVPVTITAKGTVRGRVGAGGSSSSGLRVNLDIFDLTTWSDMNNCQIGSWSSPVQFWTDAILSYSTTCSVNLIPRHYYIAYVGVDAYTYSYALAYTYSDADHNGPSGLDNKGVWMNQMTWVVP